MMSFSDLGLHSGLLRAIDAAGHTAPTPVQAAAIPVALEGRDVLATADTGTGKTGAFLLPSLHRLATADEKPSPDGVRRQRPYGPRILVLAPTRELARQVTMAARAYVKFQRLFVVDVLGGVPYRQQIRDLSRPVDVLVATPGRLLDHVRRGNVNLGEVEVLVLDEADRMLDMGFLEDIETIAAACPADRQTLLFTATLDRRMERVANSLLRKPARVAVESTPASAPKIEQRLLHADDLSHKRRLLHHLAGSDEIGKAIIFAGTKRDADELADALAAEGHAAAALHGDMPQQARTRTLGKLRDGRVRLLVATDVAARGIDIRDITHVINFDLPRNPEDYVHRIGRTGRAGAEGIAISFATRAERGALKSIERLVGNELPVHLIPGLEPSMRLAPPPRHRTSKPKAAGGPRPSASRPWKQDEGGRPARSTAGGRPRAAGSFTGTRNRDRSAGDGGWSPLGRGRA